MYSGRCRSDYRCGGYCFVSTIGPTLGRSGAGRGARNRDTGRSDGAVAILSYTPENVDRDLAVAATLLTGDFLDTYTRLADTVVAPAAKEKRVTMLAIPAGPRSSP